MPTIRYLRLRYILQKDFLKHVLKKYIKEGVENVKEEF